MEENFKHAAWSKDSIWCIWRDTIFCAISRSCADVLRGERADVTDFFLFSWPWWMGSVVKHNMLKKKVMECKMCVLIFSTTFVRHISQCKKNWARCDHISISVFMYSKSYSCKILINIEFSQLIFKKYSSTTFHENPFIVSRVFPYGRTDGHIRRG